VSASATEDDRDPGDESEASEAFKLKAICSRIMENKDKLNNWKKCQVRKKINLKNE